MTPSQLSSLLNRSAESVCRHLLPQGRKAGREWVVGGISGEPGESLKIVVDGDKAGVGSDFATGEVYGDLLDVWCASRSIGLAEAMRESASFLGVPCDSEESRPKRAYQRPPRPKSVSRIKQEGRVIQYLKSRGLTEKTLEAFRIASEDDEWVVFPYLREDGLINVKYLNLERSAEGKKNIRQEKGAEPCLFGWHTLDDKHPSTRVVCITEGEIDCMSLHQCGIPALSVPNGGGAGKKQDWIENDYDRLSRFDSIYLCLDQDGPGKEAEQEIIQRLGSERCRSVKLPFKDANECLQHGISDFHKYLLAAKSFDPSELKSADQFTDKVLDKFFPKPGSYQGMSTPWTSMTHALRFQREELIVWTGYSGSGKSQALGQVAINGMVEDERFAICSLEMPSRTTLWRMVRQLWGKKDVTEQDVRQAMDWFRERLWMVDVVGKMKTQRILEVFRYAVKRYDIRNFIIDSLLKCNIREDDLDGQKAFTDDLCDFIVQYHATLHLVAHQRKPPDDSIKPGKHGVRGASAITDEAHTVISVWRPPLQSAEASKYRKREAIPYDPAAPTTILTIEKHREEGNEGEHGLYFEPMSLQFLESQTAVPKCYINQHNTVENIGF